MIGGAITISRTWAIMVVLILVLFVFRSINKPVVWIGSIAIVLCIIYFDLIPESFMKSFVNRFSERNLGSGGGRVELFDEYNNFLYENPSYLIFGISVLGYKEVAYKIWNSTHNGIQQIYLCTGVVGFVIFILAAVMFYREFIANTHGPMYRWMPFLIAVLFLQTLQFLNPHILMLPLVMTAFILKIRDLNYHKRYKE